EQTKTEEGTLESSAQKRLELWKQGINIFQEYPLTGVGFSTTQFLGLGGGFADTHNIYIKTLTEQGITGLIILLILFWLALKSGWQLYKISDDTFLKGLGLGFVACTMATIATNLFGDRWTYLQLSAYYWVLLGLVARGNIILEKQLAYKKCLKRT
ncbi:MAG: O-antigen ligase family protein, partial [Candidatus Omnitrophica bacterium]|nr:O-antigen ligase family protein [Candidatus Omnitrophota bacterium]